MDDGTTSTVYEIFFYEPNCQGTPSQYYVDYGYNLCSNAVSSGYVATLVSTIDLSASQIAL